MSQTSTQPATSTEETADRELVITRVFDAPRSLVFACWAQQQHCQEWFAPGDCTMLAYGCDPRPGGAWHLAMRHPDGEIFKASGEYKEVVQDERIVFTHAWEGDDGQPEHWTTITVEFSEQPGGRTLMTFTQGLFRSKESRDRHQGGWSLCFDGLTQHLATLTP